MPHAVTKVSVEWVGSAREQIVDRKAAQIPAKLDNGGKHDRRQDIFSG